VKALVVRLSSIGDVIHTLPSAAALHRQGWNVGWLVEPLSRPLLDANPAVSTVTVAPPARVFRLSSARSAATRLRAERFDVALDFQGLWKSAGWARVSGAPRALGFGGAWRREPASALLAGEKAAVPAEAIHVIDKNLALLRLLGIEALGLREFPLPAAGVEQESVARQLAGLGMGTFAVLNAGGGWRNKLWPAERFGAVAIGLRDRGLRSLVTWGPGEEGLADQVVAQSDAAAVRCFPTTLLELAAILRRARVVVAADTGPLHLACAVGTPVVGIFGPTDPARNGPWARADQVVRHAPSCAPCHKRQCAIHDGVMGTIEAAEVVAAIDRRLDVGAGSRGLAV
jgi:heptosyltransferase-1